MVACATNKNNSRSKKMKTIDEDAASAPDNPIEEGIGTTLLHKGGAMSYEETSAMVSEEWPSKKEIAGTSHEAGNSADLKSDMSSPWWTGMVGMGGAMPPLQKQMKMKEKGQGSATMLPQQRTPNERRNNYARPRHSIQQKSKAQGNETWAENTKQRILTSRK